MYLVRSTWFEIIYFYLNGNAKRGVERIASMLVIFCKRGTNVWTGHFWCQKSDTDLKCKLQKSWKRRNDSILLHALKLYHEMCHLNSDFETIWQKIMVFFTFCQSVKLWSIPSYCSYRVLAKTIFQKIAMILKPLTPIYSRGHIFAWFWFFDNFK